jgi:hypothetical protein
VAIVAVVAAAKNFRRENPFFFIITNGLVLSQSDYTMCYGE